MIQFILNNDEISADQPPGTTVLDFVRYHKDLKGTKIGCREGDCGACTVLVGELKDGGVSYRTMTSCLMPLANASGKHIVTIEGINPQNGSLTPVQQAMVDHNGTQCGFCTVGFVMSLTGFCLDDTAKMPQLAVSAIDGNICRCTGYKSIERAAADVCARWTQGGSFVPGYFADIGGRLLKLKEIVHGLSPADSHLFVSGGTDAYVQRPDEMAEAEAAYLFYDDDLRSVRDLGKTIEVGASATVTDLLLSPVMQSAFPNLYDHLKLVSSTPIRNMATIGGNLINASPIGDMTIWFLALDAEVVFGHGRHIPLRNLYLDYKKLAKTDNEFIKAIRFAKPAADFRFNFEKVCKRTYLDIATVNTAISLTVEGAPGKDWTPPALTSGDEFSTHEAWLTAAFKEKGGTPTQHIDFTIKTCHVAAGGVAPIPLYLSETSNYLSGKVIDPETVENAAEIMQTEISPISDVRGTEAYKRLLLRQLFRAHFNELFGENAVSFENKSL